MVSGASKRELGEDGGKSAAAKKEKKDGLENLEVVYDSSGTAEEEEEQPSEKEKGKQPDGQKARRKMRQGFDRIFGPNPPLVPFPPKDANYLGKFIPFFYWILRYKDGPKMLVMPMAGEMEGGHIVGELVGSDPVEDGIWRTVDSFNEKFPLGCEFQVNYKADGVKRTRVFRFNEVRVVGDMGVMAVLSFPPRRQGFPVTFWCGKQPDGEKFFCEQKPSLRIVQTGRNNPFFAPARNALRDAMKVNRQYVVVESEKFEPNARNFTTVYFVPPTGPTGDPETAKEYAAREKRASKIRDFLRPIVGQIDLREWTFSSNDEIIVYVGNDPGARRNLGK